MNKLSALSKLANAYHYLVENAPKSKDGASMGDSLALFELDFRFGYIRRSLRIEDLKPQSKNTEGLNGKGPTYF